MDESYFLYPTKLPIPLGSMGMRTGWSFQTPMGISIHLKFGPWFAYRTLFLVKGKLPLSEKPNESHPCESCQDKPCISACPSGGVREIGHFGLDECAHYRIEDDSACAFLCKSRLSCPVGTEYQ